MFPQRLDAPQAYRIAQARILARPVHDVFPYDREERFLRRQLPQAPGEPQGKVQHA